MKYHIRGRIRATAKKVDWVKDFFDLEDLMSHLSIYDQIELVKFISLL